MTGANSLVETLVVETVHLECVQPENPIDFLLVLVDAVVEVEVEEAAAIWMAPDETDCSLGVHWVC